MATVAKNLNVADAAALMREQHVGNLIVAESRGDGYVPVGILTDRDVVIAVDDIIQHLAVQLNELADLIRVEQHAEHKTRP